MAALAILIALLIPPAALGMMLALGRYEEVMLPPREPGPFEVTATPTPPPVRAAAHEAARR
ncbi:hypothetical protein [Streptomyces varsoviensis]|uniref:Uncharacterized protein n=1 Tax=Streptomyces varsoviensis TaxID=67373 RepID=A0ABR5J5G1_9ACTN|nr:hypothetical protein [Streptomyces varsoviensis]KOG88584.1 hypothetical protein ADK38_18975 [Streptomyces varsoviensis]